MRRCQDELWVKKGGEGGNYDSVKVDGSTGPSSLKSKCEEVGETHDEIAYMRGVEAGMLTAGE